MAAAQKQTRTSEGRFFFSSEDSVVLAAKADLYGIATLYFGTLSDAQPFLFSFFTVNYCFKLLLLLTVNSVGPSAAKTQVTLYSL